MYHYDVVHVCIIICTCTASEGCWSMVGTDAIGKDVTMVLNLGGTPEGCSSPHFQRSFVIHEFGHVLGFQNDYNCDRLSKFFPTKKLRTNVSSSKVKSTSSECDPYSIMNCW